MPLVTVPIEPPTFDAPRPTQDCWLCCGTGAAACLPLLKVIRIDTLHLIGPRCIDTNLEVNHQFSKTPTVDEHDLGIDVLNVGRGFGRKGTCRDEHTFPGPFPMESANEFLDLGSPNGTLPSLGL